MFLEGNSSFARCSSQTILEFPKVRRGVLALYYCSCSVVLELCVGFEWL